MPLTLMFLQYIIFLFSLTLHLELTNNDRNSYNNIWKQSSTTGKMEDDYIIQYLSEKIPSFIIGLQP